ncbi:MAG: hypothetical protein NTV32_05210 [Gammaproteobacteria bacterium]|nr:hypothetical protein [Gammaproteobacteria bacterium]
MRSQPYIKSLHYSFSVLTENTVLSKIILELSEPGLKIKSGILRYSDTEGNLLEFPLGNDLSFMAMNLPTQSLNASALLCLSNGSTIEQTLGLMFVPFLAGLNMTYEQEAPSSSTFTAILSWSVLASEINNIRGFDLSSQDNQFFVGTDQNEVVLPDCTPLRPYTFAMTPDTMNGSDASSQLQVIAPKWVLIPDIAGQNGLGYSKAVDATTLQEGYQLPRDQTLAEMQAPWQMHQPETASLGKPSSLINPKTAISHTVKEYVQQHDLIQHSEAFDYGDAKATGAAAGPATQTAWNQIHQGDKTILHAGTISQTRTVQIDQQSLKTLSASNTYQDYDGHYSGEIFEQTAQNYSEQTTNEQTSLNQHLFLAPKVTESVNQLNQSSQSIAISAGQHVQAGNQAHYPKSVNAQGQSVSFGGSGASTQ